MANSIFSEVYNYEQKIQEIIFSNQNLLKLLSCNKVLEPLQSETIDNPYDLLNDCIYFKQNAIEDTNDIQKSFLFANTETKAIGNSSSYAKCFIVFDIVVHHMINEIIINGENRKRTRDIVILLDEALNGKSGIGTCLLEYEGAIALSNKNFVVRRLVYRLIEFNHSYNKNKG